MAREQQLFMVWDVCGGVELRGRQQCCCGDGCAGHGDGLQLAHRVWVLGVRVELDVVLVLVAGYHHEVADAGERCGGEVHV